MSEAVASPSQGHVPAGALRLLGDDRLARRAANGDREAFAVLYRRHHQALYRYCRAILGNGEDAADALQNTMTAALRALPGEQREIRVKPWLFRIAHNESISLLRRRPPHADLDAAAHVAAPAGSGPETKERMRQLVADLRELQDRQRTALVLRELSGLDYTEIAATLDASAPAAKQLVYEARTALHEMAEGRDMSCDEVRRSLSSEDRRVLRGRRLRAHLRACSGCHDFKQAMDVRRRDFAAMAPPLPALAAAALLKGLAGGGSGGGALAGLAAGGAGKVAAGSALAKGITTVAVVATVGAGAAGVTGNLPVVPEDQGPAREAPAAGTVPAATPALPGAATPAGAGAGRATGGGADRRAAARKRRAEDNGRRARGAHGKARLRPVKKGPRRTRPAAARERAKPDRPARSRPAERRQDAATGDEAKLPPAPVAEKPRRPGKTAEEPVLTPGTSEDLETP